MNITALRLLSGLGNQLFQYALGRAVSLRNKSELVLDDDYFHHYGNRRYGLDAFALKQRFPTKEEAAKIRVALEKMPEKKRGLFDLFSKKADKLQLIVEKLGFEIQPGVLSAPANVYLQGYWQSHGYFQEIEEVLREDLRFVKKAGAYSQEILEQIKGMQTVSMHIRRGDVVTDPEANSIFGTCEPAYYHDAISQMLEQYPGAHFFIFSDEPEWAQKNLTLPERHTIVRSSPETPAFEDLMLMSNCQHHIISNSTYAWWGAWLNPAKDKKVIRPKRWFRSRPGPDGLFPAGWIAL